MHPLAFVVSQSMRCSLFTVSHAPAWSSNVQSECAPVAIFFLFLSENQSFNRCGGSILAMTIYNFNKISFMVTLSSLITCTPYRSF